MKLKSVYAGGAMAAALLIAACNKNEDENTANGTVSTQDSTFLVQASQSNWAEIKLGSLALTNSLNDSVRMFAQMMITDHSTAQADLASVVNNITTNASINDSLSTDIIAVRDSLQALSGTAFDSAYIAGQIRSHEKALDAFNAEIAGGQNSRVKAYANDKQPIIQNHLNLADSIYARFNP